MNFLLSDTFTSSLSRLTNEEQKSVKTTSFDLQMNPANPGLKFHRLDKAKDPNFWSVRVNRDIRLIVHKTDASLMLCYVDHHDNAYRWAERRKLEVHPKTGAAQLVEIREEVREIVISKYVEEEVIKEKPLLFKNYDDEELLSYGVPEEWLADIKQANEDTLLEIADHLPAEAAEALLELAVGGKPDKAPVITTPESDPFEHPDAQRRFRVMTDVDELERALDYPWEKWTVFLHPAQKDLVTYDFNGPARVSGTAGTGKTVVALHRAVHLAKSNPDSRVLLTTFSDALSNALAVKLRRLLGDSPRVGERLDLLPIKKIGQKLYKIHFGEPDILSGDELKSLLSKASQKHPESNFPAQFLHSEWYEIVDAWNITSWEEYRDVKRLGRKTRLPENRRELLWQIFSHVRSALDQKSKITYSMLFHKLADKLKEQSNLPYDYAVIDEAQDISIGELRFLSALGRDRPNALFFSGDLGQRIFQQPFSWKSLGVDIRGRSKTLRINYRTSHQIRSQADKLLSPEISDMDGNIEDRRNTISVFNGPLPTIEVLESTDAEIKKVSQWLKERLDDGILPHEIAIFVRSKDEIERATAATKMAEAKYTLLDSDIETIPEHVSISTMHLAKGLEFRAVVIMACDDEVIPSQKRIETISDDTDLEEVYNTERHLLYVASTRARDNLLLTSSGAPSEFLDDLNMKSS